MESKDGPPMKLLADDPRMNVAGPRRKFYLIKLYGQMLRDAGYTNDALHRMSCATLEATIIPLLTKEA